MRIRAVTEADFDAWLVLWKGYQAFYKMSIATETTALTWRRFLDEAEAMHAAVAELNGVVVGMVHYLEHRSCSTPGDYCYLQDLYTEESVRGQGIGRALIEHVYVEAAKRGCARVYWLTHESNATAIRLYEQLSQRTGFIQYRRNLPL